MENYVTVQEYAKIKNVHERTVYRWIDKNDINAKKFNGKWHVQLDDNKQSNFDTDALVANLMSEKRQLQKDNEYLKEQLSKALDTIDNLQDDRQRSDTIIMQLTKQLEQKTLALEDKSRIIDEMQNRSWWRRIKMALGFSAT